MMPRGKLTPGKVDGRKKGIHHITKTPAEREERARWALKGSRAAAAKRREARQALIDAASAATARPSDQAVDQVVESWRKGAIPTIEEYEARAGRMVGYTDAHTHVRIVRELVAIDRERTAHEKERRKLVEIDELRRLLALVRDLLERARLTSGAAILTHFPDADLALKKRLAAAAEASFGSLLEDVVRRAAKHADS